jgi:hypothetical protein
MSKPNSEKHLLTSNFVRFTAYGLEYKAFKDHPLFSEIMSALKAGKVRAAVTAHNKGHKRVVTSGFTVQGDKVFYKGARLPEVFAAIYQGCLADGAEVAAVAEFFENWISKSTPASIEALGRFMVAGRMPMTDRGTFLAYKKVRADFHDIHSGKFDNSPGKHILMSRSDVDHNQHTECSTGFHHCSWGYLNEFGQDYSNRVVITEINPGDVIAVPPDYGHRKMRVSEYTVLCTLEKFKEIAGMRQQDVLGKLLFFKTAQLSGHNLLEAA